MFRWVFRLSFFVLAVVAALGLVWLVVGEMEWNASWKRPSLDGLLDSPKGRELESVLRGAMAKVEGNPQVVVAWVQGPGKKLRGAVQRTCGLMDECVLFRSRHPGDSPMRPRDVAACLKLTMNPCASAVSALQEATVPEPVEPLYRAEAADRQNQLCRTRAIAKMLDKVPDAWQRLRRRPGDMGAESFEEWAYRQKRDKKARTLRKLFAQCKNQGPPLEEATADVAAWLQKHVSCSPLGCCTVERVERLAQLEADPEFQPDPLCVGK